MTTSPETDTLPDSTHDIARVDASRRRLLKRGLLGVGAATLTSLPLSALAQTVTSSARETDEDGAFAAFMSLSAWLLSDRVLNERLGQRFFEALARTPVDGVPGLGTLVDLRDRLLALGEQREYLREDDVSEAEMALVRRVLQAWMLGTVGQSATDPQAEVIAFEHAGMYAGPRDVQVVRTYCPNRPGFWAERPA